MSDDILLVDIDKDGKREIGHQTADESIVFYNDDGSIVPGWPFIDFGNQKNALVATDFAGDKATEIIFPYHQRIPTQEEYVTVLNSAGKPANGWPQRTMGLGLWVRPQTGDVNGDGEPDILTTTGDGWIYGWDASGRLISGFPFRMADRSHSGVALDDIDGDGALELVAGLYDGTVYVWKIQDSFYDSRNTHWPVWKQNVRNTGLYSHPSPLPDIKANGSDGPITIPPTGPLTVTVSLNPGGMDGTPAEWWAAATTPFGAHWYAQGQGWVRSDTPLRGYVGPLINLPPTTILNIGGGLPSPTPTDSLFPSRALTANPNAGLPPGAYTFYFAVDTTIDGIPKEPIYVDSAEVRVK